MRIAFTAQTSTPDGAIDPRFGRASYFLFYDDQGQNWAFIDNLAGIDAAHGAGTQAAQKVAAQKADAVITGAVGPKAFKALNIAGIKVYQGAKGSISDALSQFQRGELKEATEEDASGV